MGYEKYILMIFLGWIMFYIVLPIITTNLPFGLSNATEINIFNHTTSIDSITNPPKAYAIELRNGRILRCTSYEETPCGMKLTGCHNNVTYSCMRDVKILV